MSEALTLSPTHLLVSLLEGNSVAQCLVCISFRVTRFSLVAINGSRRTDNTDSLKSHCLKGEPLASAFSASVFG